MGAHSLGKLERFRSWLRAWWEEYYEDNPLAWLLHRQVSYSSRQALSSRLQELEKSLRQAQSARDWEAVQSLLEVRGAFLRGLMKRQPFWKRSDRWWALILWSLALLTVIVCYQHGWQVIIQRELRTPAFWFLFAALLTFVPISYGGILRTLMVWERERGTDTFLWLTRLTGRHIVYGAITTLVLQQQVRAYLVFVAPLVWSAATLIWDSGLRGLWTAVLVGWLYGSFALLWLVVSVFLTIPASPNSLTNLLLYAMYGLLACAVFMLGLPVFSAAGTAWSSGKFSMFAQVDATPLWSWGWLPIWWFSLLPPVGLISLLFVAHPLWGVLQGLGYLGLTAVLMPFAVRLAEQARLRPIPEAQPAEGEW